MKEQVSVDENDSNLPCLDNWKVISPEDFDEFIRLKRLDENVKNKIKYYNELASKAYEVSINLAAIDGDLPKLKSPFELKIKALEFESLYDEEQER